ncbi:MAG TPA: hypothetical protein VK622_02885 [Puia sp.]|nr:hypothetical protein [Puia sp.]
MIKYDQQKNARWNEMRNQPDQLNVAGELPAMLNKERVFRKTNEDLSHFPTNSITFFPARADVFDCLITELVIAASIMRSGLSSDKADFRRQFAHNPLQAKAGF